MQHAEMMEGLDTNKPGLYGDINVYQRKFKRSLSGRATGELCFISCSKTLNTGEIRILESYVFFKGEIGRSGYVHQRKLRYSKHLLNNDTKK